MVGIYSNLNIGIYKILNTVNNKFYIGSTVQGFSQRWSQHRTELYRNIHSNSYLQNSWNKYGKEKFVFIEVEVLNNIKDINVIREREQYWLDQLKPAYNLSSVAAYGKMTDYGIYRLGYKKGVKCELISPEGVHHCAINLEWFAQAFKLKAPSLRDLCSGKNHLVKKWKGSIILENGSTPFLHTKKPYKGLRYQIESPEGILMCTNNMKDFCEYYNLNKSHMTNSANPNSLRKGNKGWKATKIEDASNKENLNSREANKFRLKGCSHITYIWNTKTDTKYTIGDTKYFTHLSLFDFCTEFQLNPASIRTSFNKNKTNYKEFVIYRVSLDCDIPTEKFLNAYYAKHKNFQVRKQRSCTYKYTIISPTGEIFIINKDIKSFCQKNNLDSSSVLKVARGVLSHHKQWKIIRCK